jgi:hypothetical protein
MDASILNILSDITTGVLVPIAGYFYLQAQRLKAELADFKVKVAEEYCQKDDLVRIEQKLDELRNLMISEIKRRNR